MSRINRGRKRKAELQETITKNTEARAKRTPQQQLSLLDERLGKGIGAARERAHLQKLLANSNSKNKKENK